MLFPLNFSALTELRSPPTDWRTADLTSNLESLLEAPKPGILYMIFYFFMSFLETNW